MADSSDVEYALLAYAASVLLNLPLRTETGALIVTESGVQLSSGDGAAYQLGTVENSSNGPLRMFRGWPQSTSLSIDIPPATAVNPNPTPVEVTNVSVQIDNGTWQNTTRYLSQPVTIASPVSTMLLRVVGNAVVVNGAPGVGQTVGLLYGPLGAAVAVGYRIQPGDTLASVAASLAALVPGATASGPVVTMPTDKVQARVGADATTALEVRRQSATFRIVVFAPSPTVRDNIAKAVDVTLARVSMIGLQDGSSAYVRGNRTITTDASAQSSVWRRDLLYTVEYPTVAITAVPEMLFGAFTTGTGAAITV